VTRARREHQQQFARLRHGFVGALEQDAAQLFGPRRAARLARQHDFDALRFEPGSRAPDLRRLADALAAFERDEPALHAVQRPLLFC
jgi:hypothetical protein